jgi:uncharacterized protein YegL
MESNTLIQQSLDGQPFGFSAADISDLGATEYTLVNIVVDESSSVSAYKTEMEKCIKEIVKSCKMSPRSDFLLLRIIAFNSDMREIHGFKQLQDCNLDNYEDCLHPSGMTSLFDTVQNAISATENYGKQLYDNDFEVNSIHFIISDGCNNRGNTTPDDIKASLQNIMKEEILESNMTILIGVGIGGYSDVSAYLSDFKDQADLTQYVEIDNANEKTLAKLANFISQSISSQSNSLGSGGASQPLQF